MPGIAAAFLVFIAFGGSAAPTSHWAYQPVSKPAVPQVIDLSWARTPVDRFVLAKMEERSLRPGREADRATLARRLYFDLIGLPPSAEQLRAFETNGSPKALEELVDGLLGSAHFGERWGRHWLDVARFGESVTLRGFIYKEAWRYRDYVIEAFNADLPYAQFIREQIAGDLLPGGSVPEKQRHRIATTFLALGNTNFEEQDKKQLEMDVVDEQLDTIGKAVLAQTIGCARCHDHKFDPIPTRDYYAMAGILQNVKLLEHANVSKWIEVPLPLEASEEARYAKHEASVTNVETKLKQAKEKLKKLATSASEVKSNTPAVISPSQLAGIVVDSAQAKAIGEWKHSQYSKHYIGDGYLHDINQGKGEKTLTFMPELPQAGRYEVRFAYSDAPSRSAKVPVTVFHADGETVLQINEQEPPLIEGRFVSLGQFRFEANNFSYVLVSTEGTQGYVTADAVQFVPANSVQAKEVAAKERARSPSDDLAAEVKTLEKQLKQLRDTGPKRPMVMSVQEKSDIQDLRVHMRGSVHRLAEMAPRGFLTAATHGSRPAIPANESGRRELAEWLTDAANPLTARVMVNRAWHWLFGAGLVRTTDNFGSTGESPSHPELLDYLASRFMEQGWSVKKLIREIVLSRTYQLAATTTSAQADLENRLLAHANRRRLDAECIRDAMLAVSGRLDPRAGGPTVPVELSSDYGFRYGEPRRSVYVPVLRNAMPELFETFDFADPSVTTGQRNVSTVAPQALFLMNHPFVMEQASYAARRTLALASAKTAERIKWAYQTALGRAPTAAELDLGLRHLARPDESDEDKWSRFYHALFASLDFRYLN